MVHDLSPFAWRIYENFGIRWYGLSYMVGFICAFFIIRWLADRQRAGLNPEMASDFVTYGAIGSLVGGRLGYCLFYSPDLFFKVKSSFPFWGVLAVNEGGMASHGGILGLVIACIFFARKHGISKLYLFDICSIVGPLGIMFGRLANFVNGELVGRPSDPNFAWAVKFPQDILNWPGENTAQLTQLSPLVEKVGVGREQWLESIEKFRMDMNARDMVYGTLNRIVEQIQAGDTVLREAIAPFLTARHPSQLYAAFGEGLMIFLILFFLWRRPRKQGFIAGSFVILYSIVRIIQEEFRMPDIQIGFQLWGLTRGQWLSVGMFFIGVIITFYWSRTSGKIVNGWGSSQSVSLNRK